MTEKLYLKFLRLIQRFANNRRLDAKYPIRPPVYHAGEYHYIDMLHNRAQGRVNYGRR
jgi:hypothetical protein